MINGHRQKITHGIATTAAIEKNFPKTICVTDTGDVFMELTADNKAHEEEMDEIKKSAEEAVKEAEQTKQANKEDSHSSCYIP